MSDRDVSAGVDDPISCWRDQACRMYSHLIGHETSRDVGCNF